MEKIKPPAIETLNNNGKNNGKKTGDKTSLDELGELIERETVPLKIETEPIETELLKIELEPEEEKKPAEGTSPEESTAKEKPEEILSLGERKLAELKTEIAEAIKNADQSKVGEFLNKAKGWEIFISNIENQNLFEQQKDALLEKQSEAIKKGNFSETGNIKTEIETREKQNRDKRDAARLETIKYLYPEKAQRIEKYLSEKKELRNEISAQEKLISRSYEETENLIKQGKLQEAGKIINEKILKSEERIKKIKEGGIEFIREEKTAKKEKLRREELKNKEKEGLLETGNEIKKLENQLELAEIKFAPHKEKMKWLKMPKGGEWIPVLGWGLWSLKTFYRGAKVLWHYAFNKKEIDFIANEKEIIEKNLNGRKLMYLSRKASEVFGIKALIELPKAENRYKKPERKFFGRIYEFIDRPAEYSKNQIDEFFKKFQRLTK